MRNPAIKKAADVFGSRCALALRLGVSKGAVWQWEHARDVPIEQALAIERETHGAVTVAELRPDLAAQLARCGYARSPDPAPHDLPATPSK